MLLFFFIFLFRQVAECNHPYNTTPLEEQITHEATYYMQLIARRHQEDREQFEPAEVELPEDWQEEESEVEISLTELMNYPRVRKLCRDTDQLR